MRIDQAEPASLFATLRSQPLRRWMAVGSLGVTLVLAAACGSAASSPTSTVIKQRPASTRTAGAVVSTAPAGALGTILVDRSGFTLYRFSMDGPGKTTCTGGCASEWPPLTVPTAHVTAGTGIAASELGTITRPDGMLQVTFNDMPLYRFGGDKKAGDTTGQGVAGTWFLVTASASPPPSSSSASTGTPPPVSSAAPTTPATGRSVSPQSSG
ncbi:MAG: COG4315 family predicted lipoprotein, partial [Acidimicrobiales bacterium]